MHQAVRSEERQGRRDVAQMSARLPVWERRQRVEIGAVEELHRVVRSTGVNAVVVRLDDARVLEQHERVVFALEQARSVRPACGWSCFSATVRPVDASRDTVHDAHPPGSELGLVHVAPGDVRVRRARDLAHDLLRVHRVGRTDLQE